MASALDVISRDDDLRDLLRLQHAQRLDQGFAADRVLPAGHRDRAVEQQLVGDVVPGGDGRANSE